MTVIAFESKADRIKNELQELHEERQAQFDETEAVIKRMRMKLNNGIKLTQEDFLEVIRQMAIGHGIDDKMYKVASKDAETKAVMDESPNLYECWKTQVHSGEKILTPFVENPEQYLQ